MKNFAIKRYRVSGLQGLKKTKDKSHKTKVEAEGTGHGVKVIGDRYSV